jgi:hypothetical protein
VKESNFCKVESMMRERRELQLQLDNLKKAGLMQAKYIVGGHDQAQFTKWQQDHLRDAAIDLITKQITVNNEVLIQLGVEVGR